MTELVQEQLIGKKFDSGKLQWSLLPFKSLEPVVRVLMFGAKKYSRDNWKLVPEARERYADAAMRHLVAWIGGEKTDVETGESHLAHAVCCLLFLIHFDK